VLQNSDVVPLCCPVMERNRICSMVAPTIEVDSFTIARQVEAMKIETFITNFEDLGVSVFLLNIMNVKLFYKESLYSTLFYHCKISVYLYCLGMYRCETFCLTFSFSYPGSSYV